MAALAMTALIATGRSNAPAETGAGSSGGNANAANYAKAVKFAECMRENGVRKFPDPDASGQVDNRWGSKWLVGGPRRAPGDRSGRRTPVVGCTDRASQPGRICRNVIDVDETPIKITIADTVMTARLADNATARDLAAQLPLTLTFKDFNQVEKVATLPRRLSMDGVPAGADPDIGDIGYYAPSGNLVFYYGDVGYWNGIVRIGRFDTTMELIEHQVDNFKVTIERS